MAEFYRRHSRPLPCILCAKAVNYSPLYVCSGRLAQGESTTLTRWGSEVQILHRPVKNKRFLDRILSEGANILQCRLQMLQKSHFEAKMQSWPQPFTKSTAENCRCRRLCCAYHFFWRVAFALSRIHTTYSHPSPDERCAKCSVCSDHTQ